MKTYQIFDGYHTALLDEFPIIEAKTGKEAILKLIKERGYKIKSIKRSALNDVKFSATHFIEDNGCKYKQGNTVWYAPTF